MSEDVRAIAEQQRGAGRHQEFGGTVTTVETAPLWDEEAAVAYKTWQQNPDNWARHGSDRPYHYLGSPVFFMRAGVAFAEAMQALVAAANDNMNGTAAAAGM
mmetsp:Transcript_22112/g.41459  ORF Transcript_22112/g.41459 Transcript_22112/m.41459 type:complete len:102 (-) Transcript_22112:140-445(-)